MRRYLSSLTAVLVAVMFCFGTGGEVFAQPAAEEGGQSFGEIIAAEEAPHAEDQLIVTYDEDTSSRAIKNDVAKVGSVADVTALEDQKMVLVDLKKDEVKAARILDKAGKALTVQPNYRYSVATDPKAAKPSDPYLDPSRAAVYQYYMEAVGAEAAWDLAEANQKAETIVGVVDTGVDSHHEDLKANLMTLDAKGTYKGYAFGEEEELQDDFYGHGTHVTGIIGADYGNGKGGSGVASGHSNGLVQVITTSAAADESLYTYDICRAIDYTAGEQHARVINMSFGGPGFDPMMERCIRSHYEQDGTVFVAASGNDGTDAYSTPCDYATVIAVNASDRGGNAAYFSDYGQYKDISAPGFNIMSTVPGSLYEVMSGTSMASPVVAGICGLVLDVNPDLTPAQVKNIICATTKESQQGKTFDEDLAYGNIDAEAAVQAALAASEETAAESISIKEKDTVRKTIVPKGTSLALTALVQPAACLQKVQWSSADESIATVDETGTVTGIAAGDVMIHAACGSASEQVLVTVKDAAEPKLSIRDKEDWEKDGIVIDSSAWDNGGQIVADVQPETAQAGYEFSSSDNDILFVDSLGFYMPKKPGTVTVTLWDGKGHADENKVDEMTITVWNAVSEIQMTKKTGQLDIGASFNFQAKVMDPDAYHPEITWSTSNGKGRIDPKSGAFKALKEGTCFVIAQTENETYVSCKVTITKKSYAGKDYGLKVKKSKNKKKAILTWKKIPCATSYQVQKKAAGGKWKTIRTVKKTKFTDKKLKKTSSYRVRAKFNKSGKTGWNGWSKVKTVKVKK